MIFNVGEKTEKVLSATLTAGSTQLVFTDASITNNSLIDVYTTVYGVNPTEQVQSGTTLTLTFDAQDSNIGVKVVVK